jgi:ATP-binding cassette subfamily F protein 3
MTREAPDILLLDEPTNHLDIESREALIRALNAYRGAIILVTHDPRLVELVADRLWLVAGGKVVPFDGDLDDYRRRLLEERRDARRSGAEIRMPASDDRRDQRRSAAERRTQLAPLRRAVEAAEREIAALHAEIARLDAKLADPALYEGPAARITELQVARAAAGARLQAVEDRWLEASEELETARDGDRAA